MVDCTVDSGALRLLALGVMLALIILASAAARRISGTHKKRAVVTDPSFAREKL